MEWGGLAATGVVVVLASEAHRTSVRACFHPHTTLCSPSSPRGVLQEKQERRGELEEKSSSKERARGRRAREGRLQREAPQLDEEASLALRAQHWAGPLRRPLKPCGATRWRRSQNAQKL